MLETLVPYFLQGMTSEAMTIACLWNRDLLRWKMGGSVRVMDCGQSTVGLKARAIGDCYDSEGVA